MTMVRIVTGIDPVTKTLRTALVHPFLAKLDKRPIAQIPELFRTKSGRHVASFREPAAGSDRPVPVRTGLREQARRLRQRERNALNA